MLGLMMPWRRGVNTIACNTHNLPDDGQICTKGRLNIVTTLELALGDPT